ncbi:uncharacterized protein LOC133885617 isoform X3 [Phragmites australis]|uniref:uncharacterized protein LOC133885617 isoform X3 n=1 Tax=Phragmites australis TaxID=29695 RepID=UPI002D785DC1|nr:uncharacterized protein LOC133885617 isoform X3 [Phragmites australis]
MATTEGLVPITRAYLARYYDKYPLAPLPDAAVDLAARLRALTADLAAVVPITLDEELLEQEAAGIPAHKIDENLWKNREQMEEVLFLLNKSRHSVALQQKSTPEDTEIVSILDDIETKLKDMLKKLEQFQLKNADNIFNTVMTYMPQDFRGTLIRQQRERSERNKQAEVDALVSAGGSIHDRYVLLWKQQMERRVQLAHLGSATGVYKTLVRYLVGVPQVLLDFIRQINDDNGEVFVNAPFFISAEDAGAAGARKNDEYKETIIPAGKTHEVILSVEAVNSYIAWEFSLQQGALNMVLDIGFHVEYISPSGEKTLILPYRRYEADQGNFCTVSAGSYKLVWDNSYSSFFKKSLRYKVDAVPPVVEPAVPAVEPL